ncbi:hypothetical protein CABS02_15480 [Colletotrichum abscissum]|uniref:Uncharacterized protein n=1 Tax=Colletotrichum abscissum TaxID=1671311 RepID=A0A9P9WZ48_9PEZI|nr:hypothetical protein CABS02_15480 [Colletotrichum abscissum]
MKSTRRHKRSGLYNGAEGLPAKSKADKRWTPQSHGWIRRQQVQTIPLLRRTVTGTRFKLYCMWLPGDFNLTQGKQEANMSSPPSLMGVLQQVFDQLDYAIAAIDTAADNIEKKDARQLKTTKWLVDNVDWEVNGLAMAVEATAALTTPWDGIAGSS